MSLLQTAGRVLRILADADVAGCLVGGLAVSSRCDPRFTLDADLAVAVRDDSEAERVTSFLASKGFRVALVLDQTAANRLAMVRVTEPSGISVDLLYSFSGIEAEIVAEAETLEIARGVTLPVARTGHLIATKLLSVESGRETDAADLRNLAAIADRAEWTRAQSAVELITARGFARGKDLLADLDALRGEHEPRG